MASLFTTSPSQVPPSINGTQGLYETFKYQSGICMTDPNLAITVPADVQRPTGARPSAGTVMITQLDMNYLISLPKFPN